MPEERRFDLEAPWSLRKLADVVEWAFEPSGRKAETEAGPGTQRTDPTMFYIRFDWPKVTGMA
jgi:hypothetical protein